MYTNETIEYLLPLFVKIEGLGNDYKIAIYPVTQKLWQEVMGENPSYFTGHCWLPVENVSWNECQEFIAKLNNLLKEFGETGTFRLPTAKEWEYAAKGAYHNEKFTYAGSDTIKEVAWYKGNSNDDTYLDSPIIYPDSHINPDGSKPCTTHPVGRKNPNSLGLYDMSGNVWEWCSDSYYRNNDTLGVIDNKVLRGGAWDCNEEYCRVTCRHHSMHWNNSSNNTGFRLVYIP
jgi:formylglycine-generating enzyme required for sulfatase activity